MKLLLLSTLGFGLFSAPAMATDVVKVNAVVAKILNEIVQNDDFIDAMVLTLDEAKTDLNKPSIGVSLSASTTKAAWSSEVTALTLDLEADVEAVAGGQSRLRGALTGTLSTDVMNFTKEMYDGSFFCDAFEYGLDPDVCENLETEVSQASTFEEQISAVSKAVSAAVLEFNGKISSLEMELGTQGLSEGEKEAINDEIEELQGGLKAFKSVGFETNNEGLNISYELDGILDNPSNKMTLIVEVRADYISLGLSVDAVLPEYTEMYVDYTVDFIKLLEMDTPESNAQVKGMAQAFIYLLKATVNAD